ncbi:MAG: hypothetical protein ABR975_03975 [Vulcanimicrobiaceae bacterium]|jgi:hypothetical protein
MNDAGVAGNGGDSLTRTTLQIAGTLSATLGANVVRALQRVPGVLLVDMDATMARVTVAHDGAVPLSGLITAAAGASGLATTIHRGTSPVAEASAASPAGPNDHLQRHRRIIALAAIGLVFVLADLLIPDSMPKRVAMTIVLVGAWSFYLARTFGRRQP